MMNLLHRSCFLILLLLIPLFSNAQKTTCITTNGIQLIKNGKPYYFIGSNAWHFTNLASLGDGGNRERLLKELDMLEEMGVDNLRIMAGTEGPGSQQYRIQPALQNAPGEYDEQLLQGLDYLMDELAKRDMVAVLCLNNFFMWSGGMAQYVSWAEGTEIPLPQLNTGSWDEYQAYAARFYTNKKAMSYFEDFLRFIIARKNTINGKLYTQDPTIMAWQLGNEPRGRQNVMEYAIWADKTAGLIQQLDTNHLVSLGGEGILPDGGVDTGFKVVSQSKNIDYLTAHLWIENWSWYNSRKPETYEDAVSKAKTYIQDHIDFANFAKKPLVFEEFGVPRDNGNFSSTGTTKYRDNFFQMVFDFVLRSAKESGPLAGCNFWSWAGEATSWPAGEYWKPGEPFVGDPPHELQGWYSIHKNDKNTVGVIGKNILKLSEIE